MGAATGGLLPGDDGLPGDHGRTRLYLARRHHAVYRSHQAQAGALCAQRFEEFATAGQAPKIAPLPLAAMAARYAKGTLDPFALAAKTAKAA